MTEDTATSGWLRFGLVYGLIQPEKPSLCQVAVFLMRAPDHDGYRK